MARKKKKGKTTDQAALSEQARGKSRASEPWAPKAIGGGELGGEIGDRRAKRRERILAEEPAANTMVMGKAEGR